MKMDYAKYIEDVTDDIKTCIGDMACQPILFVGSGFTKRYLGGPNWEELLRDLAGRCPEIRQFAYYKQRYPDFVDIGTQFSEKFNDWAWGAGQGQFPQELFDEASSPQIYIKHTVAEIFKDLIASGDHRLAGEIELLKKIRPHSVITTNYDQLLEGFFPEYEAIVGQKILYANHSSIGEIFKIHGCASQPESIVLTRADYDEFVKRKKYLSAKLLAFFAEHPLVFIGYRAEDSNIKAILADIDEILSEDGKLIPNIYILEWDDREMTEEYPRRERLIPVSDHRSVIIKSVVARDFSWVYSAFGAVEALQNVNPRLLRALLARTYQLVRTDIPRNPIQVDYRVLANVTEADGELAKLYGIADGADGLAFNLNFPFSLTALGQAMGYKYWHACDRLMTTIAEATGVDIKSFDNKYHFAIMNGSEVQSHRYSDSCRELLDKVRSGDEYASEVVREAEQKGRR
ncbi:SIR2 family protein [Pseudomonas sp. MH10]|uniref:SIR2 family protein n=1 Tax=Pseudomonas sp. MH10 TaxID=3048627 RepID=UPI002AC9BCF4|nr:SIR2 family protein [Pseudomonas sp. MH10]MEB0040426.1 SIR2 family protein [Pseudomonas sp. MH10]WPX61841.1 SIR2 family protein [Pseudomonas sp. MH10]